MTNLVIIDTACANLSSVKFAFERLGYHAEITRDIHKIQSADKLLLPGVGTAMAAMRNLQERKLIDCIRNCYPTDARYLLGHAANDRIFHRR